MGRYTQIPQDTFDALQLDAGVLLYNFDIEAAANDQGVAGFTDEDFICATTGGISASCAAEYSDLGEDVDNAPVNMKELKHLDSWTCTMSFTSLSNDEKGIRLALGAADIDTSGVSKIVPRKDLKQSDFSDIWWVGDKANGGFVAIKLLNALSTSGFAIQTSKAGKGQTSVELTGHVSITDQNRMPMEFYSIDGEETDPQVLETLSVNSVAGTDSGTSDITINGRALASGETVYYKVQNSVAVVTYGMKPNSTWSEATGTGTTDTEFTVTAENDKMITVIITDESGGAIAYGSATVASA